MKKQKSIIPNNDEIWKEIDWIPNLRGTYEISSYGKVKRTSCIKHNHLSDTYTISYKTKYLHPSDNGNGYRIISFMLDTEQGIKRKNFYVHKLVATAFIPNINDYSEVNHIDYDRSNNNVENLEWCSRKQNINYSKSKYCRPLKTNSGIYKYKKGKYQVRVIHSKKSYCLGIFDNYESALNARNNKLKELGVTINV